MVSSADEAILILKKWKSNSSKLRMVLGSSHVFMTLHGRVSSIDNSAVLCLGIEQENELRFDLEGAIGISFADERGLPEGFEFLKSLVVDDLIALFFEDGTRLMLLNETPA